MFDIFDINVGRYERLLRATIGLLMVAFAIWNVGSPYAFIGWIGVIPLITGLLGFCPFYRMLGISTRQKRK